MIVHVPKDGFDISDKLNKKKVLDFCHCIALNTRELPEKNSDFLTIIGSGFCVRDDIEKWGIHGDVIVANFVGLFLERDFNHHVSFHCDLFKYTTGLRNLSIRTKKFATHTIGNVNTRVRKNLEYINYIWTFSPKPRSSGLLALWIGIALGYEKILMLGIPLNKTGRFTDLINNDQKNLYYEETMKTCSDKIDFLKFNNVRSASGNTAKTFGEPTWPWIQETLNL